MDPETKTIERESLRDLLDASRAQTERPHAHVVKRTEKVRRELGREPSAFRGLVIVLLAIFGVRWLLLSIF
jgi:hypothetical protein